MGQDTMANGEHGGTDWSKVRWSYREAFKTGSDELQKIFEIITGGHPPGIAKEEKHEPTD